MDARCVGKVLKQEGRDKWNEGNKLEGGWVGQQLAKGKWRDKSSSSKREGRSGMRGTKERTVD